MPNKEFVLSIPEELAKRAEKMNLLTSEQLLELLEEQVNRELRRDAAIAEMREIMKQLDALPPMSLEKIEETIKEACAG